MTDMAFRNENVALQAKIRHLEEELKGLRSPISTGAPAAEQVPALPAIGADVARLVKAREAQEAVARRASQSSEQRTRAKIVASHAKRPQRVCVERSPGKTRVHIDRKLMRDALTEEALWHFWFFLINPGFVIAPLFAWGIIELFDVELMTGGLLGCLSWVAALAIGNVVYARLSNDSYTLDILEDGHFAMYAGASKTPALMGRRGELSVNLSDGDEAYLGWADISDRRTKVALTKLSPTDIASLRKAIEP